MEALKAEEAKEIEFNGKTYNKYQALQEQRKMERQMRKYRQDIDLLTKGEADEERIQAKRIKYQTKYSQYKAFSERMELPMQRDRIYADGLKVKTENPIEKIIVSKTGIDNGSKTSYNNSPLEDKLRKQYRKDVKEGWITALFSEDQYVKLYYDLQDKVVGLKTINDIEVTDTSPHFMARMIGTSRDPKIYAEDHRIVHRNGVEMEDVIDAIKNGEVAKTQSTTGKGISITFYGNNAAVTLNQETGILIQCNLLM